MLWGIFYLYLYLIDISIKVFHKWKYRQKQRYAYEESDESEEMFWDQEDDKSDKNREVHIAWYDLWVKIIRFYRMNKEYHRDNSEHYY